MSAPGQSRFADDPRVRAILSALEDIVDPCSAAAGLPAGLVSMGLVRAIELPSDATGHRVRVTLTITEPGCLMAAVFAETARERLASLEDIGDVDVVVDPGQVWEPGDMSPAYRERLTTARRHSLAQLQITVR